MDLEVEVLEGGAELPEDVADPVALAEPADHQGQRARLFRHHPECSEKRGARGSPGPHAAESTGSSAYCRTAQFWFMSRAPLTTGGCEPSGVKQSTPEESPPNPRTPVCPEVTGVAV